MDLTIGCTTPRNAARIIAAGMANRYKVNTMSTLHVRKASPLDATDIVKVLKAVASERVHSAIDKVWTVEQEARYLESLSQREAFYVAVDEVQGIVGFQSLDLWSSLLPSMAHVGQAGTFLFTKVAGTGSWPPVVERHSVVRASERLPQARYSSSRDEYRCTVLLSGTRIQGVRAVDPPGHRRRRRR
jgi:hypothetical protein